MEASSTVMNKAFLVVAQLLATSMICLVASSQEELPRGSWVEHGLPESSREELRSLLKDQVERQRIPGGSILLIHKGELIFAEGFGWADIAAKRPFQVTQPVKIASITKPIIATGIVAIADGNQISLDEPVSKWLPEFLNVKLYSGEPAARAPTIRELLSHTGGAPIDESPQGRPWLRDWSNGPNVTLADVVERLSKTGLAWEPGAKFGYSGSGFDTAVRAVEVATGRNFEEQLHSRIFMPLEMTETTFRPNSVVEAVIPKTYNLTTNGIVASTRKPREHNASNYVTYGGSLVTTPRDLAKFLLLHLQHGKWHGQQIISDEAIRSMHQKPKWSPTGYGLGWSLGKIGKGGQRLTIGHTGSSGTACSIDFDKQLVWLLFTQMPSPTNPALTKEPTFHQLFRDKLKEITAKLE